jgi:uncharacterized protein
MLEEVLRSYHWFDHPEGMKFAEVHKDAHRSVGHWLFLPGSMSAFHRVNNCDEIWAIHTGRLCLHVIDVTGAYTQIRIGIAVGSGEIPVVVIPRGSWQAAELPEGVSFAFGTNVCAPAFRYSEFEIGRRSVLIRAYPQHRDIILRLSHKQA